MTMPLRLTGLLLLALAAPASGQGGKPAPGNAPREKLSADAVQAKLRGRTDVIADRVPLQDVLQKLSKQHGVPIELDKPGLEKAGVAPDVRVSVTLKNFTLDAALRRILTERGLGTYVDDTGVIKVTDATNALNKGLGVGRADANGRAAVLVNADARAVEANMQHYLPQFQRLLRNELRLVESVCQPTPEQLQKLMADGELHVREAARNYSQAVRTRQRNPANASANPDLDPRARIQEKLAGSVTAHLTGPQSAAYSRELSERVQATRRAVVTNVVARLDRVLFLSADQRERLCESLTANWTDAHSQPLEMFRYIDDSYWIPSVPEASVLPHLTESQKKVWAGMPKATADFRFSIEFDIE